MNLCEMVGINPEMDEAAIAGGDAASKFPTRSNPGWARACSVA